MEATPKMETISLSPVEKGLYEKCLSKFPDMTIMAWKEIRQNAVNAKDPGAKKFYVVNGILVEEKPDIDSLKEFSPKNLN